MKRRLLKLTAVLVVALDVWVAPVAFGDATQPASLMDVAQPPSAQQLDEVIVTASRRDTLVREAPVKVTVIDRDEIERSPAQTLDELMRGITDIAAKRTHVAECGPGREITLRGINEQKRTLVLLDGVPMNDGINGAVNWSIVSTDIVERVEIVPGPMSALYGSGAMGGVINIITRTPKKNNETGLRLGYGSLDTYSASLVQGGHFDNLDYLVSGRITDTDGYIPVKDPEPFHSDNERTDKNLFGKVTAFQDNISSITAGVSYVDEDYNRGVRTDNQENKKAGLNLTYKRSPDPDSELVATVYGHLMDRNLELGARPDYATLDHTEQEDSYRIGELFKYSSALNRVHTLTAGLDSTLAVMDKENVYNASDRRGKAEGKQALVSLFAQDEMAYDMGRNRMVVNLGVRGDYCKSFDGASSDTDPGRFDPVDEQYDDRSWTAFNPKLSLAYLVGDRTTFRLSGGKSFAAPTLFEMYTVFTRGPMLLYGNPELDPETALSGEIGMDHRFTDKLMTRLSAYYTKGEDFIGSREIDTNQYLMDNITEITASGANVELHYDIDERWSVYGWYNYNRSRVEKDDVDPTTEGNRLPFAADHRAKAGIVARYMPFVTVDLSVRYEGERDVDLANTDHTRLDDYVTVDLSLLGRINDHLGWKLAAENLLDEPYDVYSIPTYLSESPGILINGEIQLNF